MVEFVAFPVSFVELVSLVELVAFPVSFVELFAFPVSFVELVSLVEFVPFDVSLVVVLDSLLLPFEVLVSLVVWLVVVLTSVEFVSLLLLAVSLTVASSNIQHTVIGCGIYGISSYCLILYTIFTG